MNSMRYAISEMAWMVFPKPLKNERFEVWSDVLNNQAIKRNHGQHVTYISSAKMPLSLLL